MNALYLSQLALWLISVVMGSLGIFCLWTSFYLPWSAGHAMILLLAATIIQMGAPKQ